MTYQICYTPKDSSENNRAFCLFDIEYYRKQAEDRNLWFSEIHCLPVVDEITRFLKDKRERQDFDYETFIKDATEIQEIRGLLHESFDNKPKSKEDSNQFHYHVFKKVIEEIFDEFAYRYDFSIKRD